MTPVIQMYHSKRSTDAVSESITNSGRQNMIDWVEGYLEMKKLIQTMHDLMLKNQKEEAKDMCVQISAVARLTAHKLSIEE